jgi:hypothetical protein
MMLWVPHAGRDHSALAVELEHAVLELHPDERTHASQRVVRFPDESFV